MMIWRLSLKSGDRVLAQDPLTGELAYRAVLRTTIGNQPLLSIDAGDKPIVATLGHVFSNTDNGRGQNKPRPA